MAQRFNAPPGWNVPPDFVPTSDWQPDPSWPQAPEGWNYWVEDSAQPAPAYGTPTSPAYGTPNDQPYGTPAGQGATPYGSASVPNAPYTAPAGAFGSTAPGSANVVMAEQQAAAGKRNMLIGIGIFVVAIVVWVVSYSAAGPGDRYFAPWYFVLIGIILTIRGLIDMNKAKKAQAAQLGYGQGSVPPGVTQPGTTPPGQNPPGF